MMSLLKDADDYREVVDTVVEAGRKVLTARAL
jgi:hypothetical protein